MEGLRYFLVAKLYLLSDKGGCDMTMAQFSKDDILIYQGREEGKEEGI